MRPRQILIALGMAATAAACSGTSPTSPPVDAPFRVVNVSPARGQSLSRGAVSVSLTVASDFPGRLTLSIRDQSGANVLTAEPAADVAAGVVTTLEVFFAVPAAASSIDVRGDFLPHAAGAPAVVSVQYAVR